VEREAADENRTDRDQHRRPPAPQLKSEQRINDAVTQQGYREQKCGPCGESCVLER
jgi:hypothetical protein